MHGVYMMMQGVVGCRVYDTRAMSLCAYVRMSLCASHIVLSSQAKGTIDQPGHMFGETCFDPHSPTRSAAVRAVSDVTYLELSALVSAYSCV